MEGRRRAIRTPGAPAPKGPYAQGIVIGGMVFTAGEGPSDPKTGRTPEGITAQTVQAIANVRAILKAAGCSLDDVVKVTVHLADLDLFAEFNAAYSRYFGRVPAVRTTVGSRLLGGILVEIDAIAVLPQSDGL